MRRIQPPTCSCCEVSNAMFESDRWPSVRLCHTCWRSIIEWFIDNGLVHGNPIAWELVTGTDNGVRDEAQRFWRLVIQQSSTYYEFWIEKTSPDSKIPVDNTLDLLDEL